MPSNRRLRITGCIVALTFLIILYVTRGASSTQNSPFYTRTVEAIRNRHDAESRQALLEEEKERMARVNRIEKEHDKALEMKASASSAAVVHKPGEVYGETDDGVAKVGNIPSKPTSLDDGEHDEAGRREDLEDKAATELDAILKKSPITIFSKSYCRYSKKAKHILLELYDISPPPYVVELDHHELGFSLQQKLQASTGRNTVPNVLINGKSIGGGDDVEELHNAGTLAQTIQSMGGQQVVEVKPKESA